MEYNGLEDVVCGLCDLRQEEFLFKDNGFNLVRCRNCGLVYVNPRPKDAPQAEDAGHFKEYLKGMTGRTIEAKKILGEITKKAKAGKILDIGCAAGYFLKAARAEGWTVKGVERSRMFCDYAKDEFGLDVFCGTLESADLKDGLFDVITMLDVLSHLRSPKRTLSLANRALRQGGLLVIKTGNKGELGRKKLGETFGVSWNTPEHLCHFSKKALKILLEKTNFNIEKIDITANVSNIISPKNIGVDKSAPMSSLAEECKRYIYPAYRLARAAIDLSFGKILPMFVTMDSTVVVYAKKRS